MTRRESLGHTRRVFTRTAKVVNVSTKELKS